MADLLSICIRFNGGNPQLSKFWYINVTLKGLKDELYEINHGLNPEDTRRLKYVQRGENNVKSAGVNE